MEYDASITVTKVLDQVLVHMEVRRQAGTYWPVVIWSWTDTQVEQAHPEPQKWIREHVMTAFMEQQP